MFGRALLTLITCVLILSTPVSLRAQESAKSEEASELIAVLKKPDATDFEKALACKRLAVVGSVEAVPVLREMLLDAKFSHYARYALEPIPSPVVDEALREALSKAEGSVRLGVINSIGARRDRSAIPMLAQLLEHEDPAVVDAAASALGRIASAESAEILAKKLASEKATTRRAVGDALLICADRLLTEGQRDAARAAWDAVRSADVPPPIKLAALRGAILVRGSDGMSLWQEQLLSADETLFVMALHVAREMLAADVTPVLLEALGKLPEGRAALVLEALADIAPAQAREPARRLVNSGADVVRCAAVRALGKIGNGSDITLLLQAATDGREAVAKEAQAALEALKGPEVNRKLAEQLSAASKPQLLVLLQVLGQRRASEALPAIRQATRSGDSDIRAAAVTALGKVARDEDIPSLVKQMIGATSAEEVGVLMEALRTACQRVGDREKVGQVLAQELNTSPPGARANVLELLGVLGGKTALDAVVQAARSSDSDLQDAATAVLGNWLSPDVAPAIWSLIESNAAPRYRVRLIRAYIRVARQFNVPENERLEMCRRALSVADRAEEKRLVLDVLRRNPSPGSLALAAEMMETGELRAAACEAVVTIAEKLSGNAPGMKETLRKVVEAAANPQVRSRAESLLKQLQ